ncbi:hypothetical protein AWW68_10505 [Roseivirga spongicola]|uniref:Uncharacterized protein n=1 Tax=Roseivirga spongicola TaxID=333140 RepID=A0A150X923_9BACT|nr:hypothetical protein AWW68_10505 [Roseivirga spongicola]
MTKTIKVFQTLLILTYFAFYFFPTWFDFNSQRWSHYILAFLFGTLIVTGIYGLQSKSQNRKRN